MSEKFKCLVCDSYEKRKSYFIPENMFGWKHLFLYEECVDCRSLQIKDIPINLEDYYSNQYYTSKDLIFSNPLKIFYKRLRWKLFKRNIFRFKKIKFLDWISPLDLNLNDKIADIGCGNGQLLYEMYCSGFSNLHGYDPFLNKELSMNGLVLEKCQLEEIKESFDVIMLHHSFEHMPDPKSSFKKLASLLNPNGKLLIRVPVTDAEIWEKENINWFQLDAPRHLFIPSVKAMRIMGDLEGLSLTKIIFDSNEKQFVITEMYKKGFSLKDSDPEKFVNRKMKMELLMKAKLLNKIQKGDQACFYFKKAR
ncbi:class I SAM-dependent methyltransferase [Belliella pelovolcani]|uniref:Methyltransferase domain-containing protein n=1 Tax=Belliella pelovolcani TaxID=529505 RepID=A0A1N7KHU2_9BACT|nr:class I SAM-dependent methyltransferase [Belliella pelovolcani]SIS61054.1 Methyltransferase domain-containing protein [Belliella pelovolcani]